MGKALIKFFFSGLALLFAILLLVEAWQSEPSLKSLSLGGTGLLLLCAPLLLFRYYLFSCGLIFVGMGIVGVVGGSDGLTLTSAALILLAWSLIAWPFVLNKTVHRGKKPNKFFQIIGFISVILGLHVMRSSPNFMLAGAPIFLAIGITWCFVAWKLRGRLAADGDDVEEPTINSQKGEAGVPRHPPI